jgi:hypothetical protein
MHVGLYVVDDMLDCIPTWKIKVCESSEDMNLLGKDSGRSQVQWLNSEQRDTGTTTEYYKL